MKTVTLILWDATGEVGVVYKTKTGTDFAHPNEDSEGWQQMTADRRVKVFSAKIGHSTHAWERVEVEAPPPLEYAW